MCWVLNNPVINTNIKVQYLNQLKILEYATVNGSLRQKKLIADFEAFWGSGILDEADLKHIIACNTLKEYLGELLKVNDIEEEKVNAKEIKNLIS